MQIRQLLSFLFCLLCAFTTLKAEVSSFDIVEIEIEDQRFFFQYERIGSLNENDWCYYYKETNGDTIVMRDLELNISHFLENSDESNGFYSEMIIINLENIPIESSFIEKQLYILKNKTRMKWIKGQSSFRIINVHKGNIGGIIYSASLNELDNYWLNDYKIDFLFHIEDTIGLCDMGFYGIKNNYLDSELKEIRIKLYHLLNNQKHEAFEKVLEKLHRRNIIMLGICSC